MDKLTETAISAGIPLKYLPELTSYLCRNRMDDFIPRIEALYEHPKMPALKEIMLSSATAENRREYIKRLLAHLVKGDLNAFVREDVKMWMHSNPLLAPVNELLRDSITFGYLRKQLIMSFLQEFTMEKEIEAGISSEIDLINSEVQKSLVDHLLQYQQDLFKKVQSLASLGNWLWDINSGRMTWSDEIYNIYGIKAQTPVTFQQAIANCHPEDREIVAEEIRRCANNNLPFDLYFRIISRNGSEKVVHSLGRVVEYAEGKPLRMFGTLQEVTRQKKAEMELEENRNLIRKIADLTPSLIALYNIQTGKYIFVNQAVHTMLGYSAQEVLDEGVEFFIRKLHPDDVESLMQSNAKAIEEANSNHSGIIREFIYRLQNIEGKYRWLHTYGTVFNRDPAGNVESVLNISVDVTDEIESKKLAVEEKKFADLLIENSPDMILALDDKLRITTWNKKCEMHNEMSQQEVIGRNIFELFPEYDNIKWRKTFQDVLNGKNLHYPRITFVRSKGYGELFLIPFTNKDGKTKGILSICREITEIVESTEQLEIQNEAIRQSEEKYHSMVEEVQDYAMILLDVNGTIENWNRGASKIKGYRAQEIVGRNFRVFYSREDQANKRPDKLLKEARLNGRATDEGWRIRKDGSRFWGFTVITALHNKQNEVTGFSKVTRDLTLKKLAEDQLRRHAITMEQKNVELQKTNKELESFSYVASHDLQEPLRKIQAFSNRILEKEKAALSESGKDMFTRIQSAAARMQELIDALLNFSRTNTAPRIFEVTDMNILMQEVCSNLKEALEEKQATVSVDPLPLMRVIPFQLQQVFTNLINNSLKYSKPDVKPQIKISLDVVSGESIGLNAPEHAQKFYAISVKDNGIGFEQKYASKVFELFQRLHGRNEYSGTGIGLSICKKIAENHHGIITAHGVPGEGATFTIYIPVSIHELEN